MSVQEKFDKLQNTINEYLTSLKASVSLGISNEVEMVMSFTIDKIKRLTVQECYEFALCMDRYAFFLQSEINKHSARKAWGEHNLEITIGDLLLKKSYGTQYTKFEEKKLIIISDNEYCKALYTLIASASARVKTLEGLASKANVIGKTLKDMAYLKRGENNG